MARHKWKKQEHHQAMKSRPATPNQLAEIQRLATLVGAPLEPMIPMTCWQASQEIDALHARRRNGIFGRAATLPTELRLSL